MDTDLANNAELVREIQLKGLVSSILQAALESAPQIILQSFIICTTGNIGECLKLFNKC